MCVNTILTGILFTIVNTLISSMLFGYNFLSFYVNVSGMKETRTCNFLLFYVILTMKWKSKKLYPNDMEMIRTFTMTSQVLMLMLTLL